MFPMIGNEQGQIAVVNYQPSPYTVQVGSTIYRFYVRNGVALEWVNEEHLSKVFSVTKTCCGGNVKHIFRYATQSQVNVWSGTGR